jgi:hypothetical protein
MGCSARQVLKGMRGDLCCQCGRFHAKMVSWREQFVAASTVLVTRLAVWIWLGCNADGLCTSLLGMRM